MKNNKKELLAYCGLYCGDCGGFSDEITDAAINLQKVLSRYKFDLTAKYLFSEKLKEYNKFLDILQFITELKCKTICREMKDKEGTCMVRKCCRKKGYFACFECDIYEECEILRKTNPKELYGDSYLKNFRAIKNMGLEKWIEEGKRYWFVND